MVGAASGAADTAEKASASPLSSSVFHAACALSAPAGHLPLEGKATIREYPLLKRRHTPLLNLSAPQAPSSRAQPSIFIALPPYAHMHPHSNDTLVLPFSSFPHPRFTGLQKRSLHFGPHDTQERRIVSYRFSYRCVELCLFEALYPAPLARPFSKGLLVSLL